MLTLQRRSYNLMMNVIKHLLAALVLLKYLVKATLQSDLKIKNVFRVGKT